MNKKQKIILGLGAVGLSAYLIYKYKNKKSFDAGITQSQANSLVTQRKNADPRSSIESICNNLGGFYSYKGGPDFSKLSPEGCTDNCQRCLIQKSASQIACENKGGTWNKYGEDCSVNAPAEAPVVTLTPEDLKKIPEYWKYIAGTVNIPPPYTTDPSIVEWEISKKNACDSSGKLWYVDIQYTPSQINPSQPTETRTYYCLPKPPAPVIPITPTVSIPDESTTIETPNKNGELTTPEEIAITDEVLDSINIDETSGGVSGGGGYSGGGGGIPETPVEEIPASTEMPIQKTDMTPFLIAGGIGLLLWLNKD
jgi:hypothetical protein